MLLGMHGKLNSGKDTVLERLQVLYPELFVRHSFADKLKDSACSLLGIDRDTMERLKRMEDFNFLSVWDADSEQFTQYGEPSHELTMRTFLQRYGTEAHRDVFGQNFWVDQAMAPALEDERNGLVPVFTDTRFPNEAEEVIVKLGQVWLVEGPPPENVEADAHASETPLPSNMIARTIDNTVRDDGFEFLDMQLREGVEHLIQSGYMKGIE